MSKQHHPVQPSPPYEVTQNQDVLEERRAALAKLGLLAGYVAPATLSLLVAPRCSAASEPLEGPPNNF